MVLAFIQQTQPGTWAKLEGLHGARTGEQVLEDLCKWMDAHGSLATQRPGSKCYGREIHLAVFKAAHGLNPDLDAGYAANRVGISRQLRYSTNSEKSLVVVLSVNGVPLVTLDLKNPMTGQNVEHARRQYQRDSSVCSLCSLPARSAGPPAAAFALRRRDSPTESSQRRTRRFGPPSGRGPPT